MNLPDRPLEAPGGESADGLDYPTLPPPDPGQLETESGQFDSAKPCLAYNPGMLYGKVVGTVWATRKDPEIEGLPLLAVEQLKLDGTPLGSYLVAVDTVSAGVGEVVLVAQGSSARQTERTKDRPVDAVIMAIVENLEVR